MTVRAFTADDYPAFCARWRDSGALPPPLEWLPAGGFIVADDQGDIASLHVYLDNSRGVAFPHWICFAARLSLREKKEAGRQLVAVGEGWLREIGYSLMIMQTVRGVAAILERLGFHANEREAVTMHKFIPLEAHGS